MDGETIQLKNLGIGYPTKHGVRTVAEGIDGTIRSGELTCLLGANGVGKSTLLRTLSAFQPKIKGNVFIEGREISDYSDKKLSKLIGVVLTEKPDVRNMRVRELVSLGRSPYTGFWGTYSKEDLRIVDEAISLVGIDSLSGRMVHTLSDGERQKVMIAKALAQQTPVIYLDEPTAFLDYPSKVEVLQLLRRISKEAEKTIFLSTHDVELALQLADTVWLMTREGGMTIGTPLQLAQQGALGSFIEREGITFDPETLTIRVKRNN
jgi:iron complex transport system ATP-binding protein